MLGQDECRVPQRLPIFGGFIEYLGVDLVQRSRGAIIPKNGLNRFVFDDD